MKRKYYQDRNKEIERYQNKYNQVALNLENVSHLPKPIQKFYNISGYLNAPIAMNADIIWKESSIKLKPNSSWKKLKTLQFNAVNPIMRTAYMKVDKMFFAGKDIYKNGQGKMKGKILNLFNVMNAEGDEISQSALITIFAEFMLVSGYAIQNYVEWETIDKNTVRGTLHDHKFTVTGNFHFDEEGKFRRFDSMDRYYSLDNGQFEKKKFMVNINSYKKINNFFSPEQVSASWLIDGKEYTYYKGTIERIDYNVGKEQLKTS